jgi:hypothetical protein
MTLQVERLDAGDRGQAFMRAIGVDAFPPWLIWADPDSDLYWDRIRAWFPQFQIVLTDNDTTVASAWAIPLQWSGEVADLPTGYTDSLRRAVQDHEAANPVNTLVVCAAVVLPGRTRSGRAGELLIAMRDLPAAAELDHVLVPVRPTFKPSYPLTDIDTYTSWTRADGQPLDPWLRTHLRIGGRVLATAPASQTLRAPVASWEDWTGLALPTTGQYVIPGGPSPLHLDCENDLGTLVEANIWIEHR